MYLGQTEILQIDPARCRGDCQIKQRHAAEVKLDGHRCLLHTGEFLERPQLTSRRVSKATGLFREMGSNVPHILEAAKDFCASQVSGYSVFDGELIVRDHAREDVQSISGGHPDTAIQWQEEHAWASIRFFDVLIFNGRDTRSQSWTQRNQLLQSLSKAWLGVSKGYIDIVRPQLGLDHTAYFDRVVHCGGEGLVLKTPETSYGVGWTKLKHEETFDVVILGFTPGNRKYRGMFGAVEFGAYRGNRLVKIGQCSGMPDGDCYWVSEEGKSVNPNSPGAILRPFLGSWKQPVGSRAWFHQSREDLIGSVMEVKCNGVTRKGSLTHPRFVGMRPDKSSEQCYAPEIGGCHGR